MLSPAAMSDATSARAMLGGMPVLHDAGDWFALAKPSGLPVHRGYTGERDTVVDRLREPLGGVVHVAHRLDRGTSGVLLIARSADVARELSEAFATRQVDKVYIALVRGVAPADVLLDHAIPNGPEKDAPRIDARTRLRSLGMVHLVDSPLREPRYSLVRADPETGRFHQVRRHLSHLAHPILGDSDHGRPDHNRFLRARVGLARLALHAAELRLPGWPAPVRAPLPGDLAEPLRAMGFAAPLVDALAAGRFDEPVASG